MAKVLVPFDKSGNLLTMPPVCICCGKPATRTLKLEFYGRARTFLGMRFVSEDQDHVVANTPLCSGHPLMGASVLVAIVGFFVIVAIVLLWVLLKWLNPQLPQSMFNTVIAVGIPLWGVAILWLMLTTVRSDGYDDDGLLIRGAHPKFVDAMEDYDGTASEFKARLKKNRQRNPYKKPPFWMSPLFFVPVAGFGLALILAPVGWLMSPAPGGNVPPRQGPPAAPPPNVTGDQRIDAALATLAGDNVQAWHTAADELAKMPVDDKHRATVAHKLGQRMDTQDGFARRSIIAALGVWGTPNEVPALLKAFDNKDDRFTVAAALDVVGKFKDERLVAPVIALLSSFGEADKALRDLGPVAEGEVIKLLQHQDADMRQRAVNLLQDVGTQKSIPALQAVLAGNDDNLKEAARQSLRRVAFAGKAPTFEGSWEGTNSPKDFWTIAKDKDSWKVTVKYYQDKTEVGASHGENYRVDNGTLTFTQVFDKKPSPLWSDNPVMTFRLEGPAEISLSWKAGIARGDGKLLRSLP